MRQRSHVVIAIALLGWAKIAFAAEAAQNSEVKLLCSFEPDELAKKGFKPAPWSKGDGLLIAGLSANVGPGDGLLRKEHATDGEWAFCCHYGDNNVTFPSAFKSKDENGEQYASFRFLLCLTSQKLLERDWSGFDYLCFDIYSAEGDLWLRTLIQDTNDTSPYVRHHVPKGASTIAIPIGKYADPKRNNHIDLKNIVSLAVHLDSWDAATGDVYVDNLRLVKGIAPKGAVEPCQEIDRDWGWSELAKKHAPVKLEQVAHEAGPCEKIGPVTLSSGLKMDLNGLLNGHDKLYYFTAISAVDNKRLLVISHAGALASYDGGKTWGNLEGASADPTKLNAGHGVANDGPGGNIYIANSTVPILPKGFATDNLELSDGPECLKRFKTITSQCHYDIRTVGLQFVSLKDGHFQAMGGINAPMTIFDDYVRHCPGGFDLIRTPGGRMFAFLDHNGEVSGFGVRAAYSDDNGLTWTRSHPTRWIGGSIYMKPFFVAPYKDQAALLAYADTGVVWTFFDGKEWTAPEKIDRARVENVFALASSPSQSDKLCALMQRQNKLVLARLADGKWGSLDSDPVLDDGSKGAFGSPVLTVSGDMLFCFWTRDFEKGADNVAHSKIILRRYNLRTGQLAAEEDIATEQEPIFRLSAPHVCPPDYAALVWANSYSDYARYGFKDYAEAMKQMPPKYPKWLRFVKLPNPATR